MVVFAFIIIIPVTVVQVGIDLSGTFWGVSKPVFCQDSIYLHFPAERNFLPVRRNFQIICIVKFIKIIPGLTAVSGDKNLVFFLCINSIFVPLHKRFFSKIKGLCVSVVQI